MYFIMPFVGVISMTHTHLPVGQNHAHGATYGGAITRTPKQGYQHDTRTYNKPATVTKPATETDLFEPARQKLFDSTRTCGE